jgi:FHA domain
MATVTCGTCTASIPSTVLICPQCNSFVLAAPKQTVAAPTSPAHPPVTEEGLVSPLAAPSRLCPMPWCRREIPQGATACPACGEPISAIPMAPRQSRATAVTHARVVLPGGVQAQAVQGTAMILGRESPQQNISAALDHFDGVSRRHLEVRVEPAGVTLTDLQSKNGSFVDGVQLSEPLELRCGRHEIRLGQFATLQLEILTEEDA